jgi:O-antigen/teichoic acid export membrane protein
MSRLAQIWKYWVDQSPNATVRRSARNAMWNSVDYVVLPAALLFLTPFFVSRLGAQQFGIWVLANAIAGLTGVFGLGLGEATIKYVSSYRARKDWTSVRRIVQSTLTMYGALGTLTALAIASRASFLAARVFHVAPQQTYLALTTIRLAGLCFGIRSIQGVLQSAVQGFERYDLSARVNIVSKGLVLAGSAYLVLHHKGVPEILLLTNLVAVLSTIALASALRGLLPGLVLWPSFDRAVLREVFGFGLYTWLQNIAGTVFAQADVLLVGAFLGPAAVTAYSVCQRLGMQIHGVLSAGSSFLFPMSSVAAEQGHVEKMRAIYSRAMKLVVLAAVAMGLPLYLLSSSILKAWMGAGFANENTEILKVLALGYALLATSIVPYNLLNGAGQVKINTALSWFSLALIVLATAVSAPAFGLVGVAYAKLVNVIPLATAMVVVNRRIFRQKAIGQVALQFVPIVLPFALGGFWARVYGIPRFDTAFGIIMAVGVSGVFTLFVGILAQEACKFILRRPPAGETAA